MMGFLIPGKETGYETEFYKVIVFRNMRTFLRDDDRLYGIRGRGDRSDRLPRLFLGRDPTDLHAI